MKQILLVIIILYYCCYCSSRFEKQVSYCVVKHYAAKWWWCLYFLSSYSGREGQGFRLYLASSSPEKHQSVLIGPSDLTSLTLYHQGQPHQEPLEAVMITFYIRFS